MFVSVIGARLVRDCDPNTFCLLFWLCFIDLIRYGRIDTTYYIPPLLGTTVVVNTETVIHKLKFNALKYFLCELRCKRAHNRSDLDDYKLPIYCNIQLLHIISTNRPINWCTCILYNVIMIWVCVSFSIKYFLKCDLRQTVVAKKK